MTRPLSVLIFTLSLSLPAAAQEPAARPVQDAFDAWKAEHGPDWMLRVNPATGAGRFLFGGTRPAPFGASSDAEFVELARFAVNEVSGMFGLDPSSLSPVGVHRLALGRVGGSDKVAVEFRQTVQGVPVVRGSVSVLLARDGGILAVDSNALPGVERLVLAPAVDPGRAIAAAEQAYGQLETRLPSEVGTPQLVIYPWKPGKQLIARLAWSIELRNPTTDGDPSGRRLYVAADGAADVLGNDALVHNCSVPPGDLTGHVDSWATPGLDPDTAANPETQQAMRALRVTSSAGNAVTDANGNFTISNSGTTPVNVTFAYTGPNANVVNQAGSNYSLTQSFTPGVFQNVIMNPAQTDQITAQANAFANIVAFRAWLLGVDPAETTLNFQVRGNVNISSTCNAYYDGVSVNFFLAGGGCPNTAYSTVVSHEEGHWANDLYGSGNGSDGFGEGNADVWSMYVHDTPVIGEDFFGPGGCPGACVRTGDNTRQYCGDGNGGCYGEVHADGEVIMGALWKVRRNLNTSLGNSAGDAIADALLVAWMQAFNDSQIDSVIEDHWLALDDDNGTLSDLTPDFGDIDGAFREQGFPGIPVLHLTHSELPDTQNEAGPYVVNADITSVFGTTVTAATLHYRVNGGGFQTVAMTQGAGSTWTGNIPGQQSVAFVDYDIDAQDNQNNTVRGPQSGEYSFIVGVVTPVYFNDFEGATDEGWTHVQVATQDDWQHGTPQGKADDPSGAYSGLRSWGNDLGIITNYDGMYEANVDNHLDSPVIDCTGKTGVHLMFQRWLNVEQAIYDHARVYVLDNGTWTVVYENQMVGDTRQNAWNQADIDVSAYADNNATLQVRFEMTSDGGLEYGGWNIDDFSVVSVEPVPGGTDTILLTGSTTVPPRGHVSYSISNAPASSPWVLYYAFNLNGSVIHGQPFDIGTPRFIAAGGTTSAAGTASWTSGRVPASASGHTVYVEARADGAQTFDSNPVTLVVQ